MSRVDTLLAFTICSGDQVHADFAACYAWTVLYTDQKGVPICQVLSKASCIAYGRCHAVEEASISKATHLLFLDSDMTFPHDTAVRLLAQLEKDRTALVAAATYRKRAPPHDLNHYELDGSRGVLAETDKGVREVSLIGTGCMLINMNVFRGMEKPYFRFGVRKGVNNIIGEDYLFCETVREQGGKILMDCDLSHQICHLGQAAFPTDQKAIEAVTATLGQRPVEVPQTAAESS
jgi:hypothetical protein